MEAESKSPAIRFMSTIFGAESSPGDRSLRATRAVILIIACAIAVGARAATAQDLLPTPSQILEQLAVARTAVLRSSTPMNICAIDMFYDSHGRVIRAIDESKIRFPERANCPTTEADKRRYASEPSQTFVASVKQFKDSVVVTGGSRNGSTRVAETYVFARVYPGKEFRFTLKEYRITSWSQD